MTTGKKWLASLVCLLCLVCIAAWLKSSKTAAKRSKPVLTVSQDGLPNGHASPEGAACDLARAFIKHDVTLFKETCIKPYGRNGGSRPYAAFLQQVARDMIKEGKRAKPSPGGPKFIGKVFAARHLSLDGPASYGYAVCGFKEVEFVDIGVLLHNGDQCLNRTLVIQAANGQWYVHPMPSDDPLLSMGLNDEKPSTQDFSSVYTIVKPANAVRQ